MFRLNSCMLSLVILTSVFSCYASEAPKFPITRKKIYAGSMSWNGSKCAYTLTHINANHQNIYLVNNNQKVTKDQFKELRAMHNSRPRTPTIPHSIESYSGNFPYSKEAFKISYTKMDNKKSYSGYFGNNPAYPINDVTFGFLKKAWEQQRKQRRNPMTSTHRPT